MKRIAILALTLAAVASARAGTLVVAQYRWGYDGRVVPGRINLLSVEVQNPSSKPFEGLLRLQKADLMKRRLGAVLVEPCFLSPGAARWVQFYPYVRHEHEVWSIEWGRDAEDQLELKEPGLGPPARVLLADPSAPVAAQAGLSVLPDNLFPPTVAATDGLQGVVLDHAPRWEPVRQQAFLDWLRRGGEAHVVHGPDGRFPTFSGELAVLNVALDRTCVGAGTLIRHALSAREVTDKWLVEAGFPGLRLETSNEASVQSVEEAVFGTLEGFTRPEHNWTVIYLVSLAYILLIGLFNFLFGRNRRDYRFTILFFLLCVGGCSLVFGFFGRRGSGETTAVHSLACARSLGGGDYDVTQWTSAFVTRGATYAITHDAPHNLYSTCQDYEAVPGMIHNGKGGVFQVEIPLFSHRSFLHRARMKGHPIRLNVVRWQAGELLTELVLEPGPGFPADAAEMHVLHGSTFYPLKADGGRLNALTQSPLASKLFFDGIADQIGQQWQPRFGRARQEDPTPAAGYQRLCCLLIAREVGGTDALYHRVTTLPLPLDRVAVFIFTRSPETFQPVGDRLGRSAGYVLYRIDLLKPETPNG